MDRPYNVTQRIVKTDYRSIEGKNYRERPRLEYIQQIRTKDATHM